MLYYVAGLILGCFFFWQIPAFGLESPPHFLFAGQVDFARSPAAPARPAAKRKAESGRVPKASGGKQKTAGKPAPVETKASADLLVAGKSNETLLAQRKLLALFNGIVSGRLSGPGQRTVHLTNGKSFNLIEPIRAHVPFTGFGFLRYVKVAGGIELVSPTGELLWKKSHPVYPYAHHGGKLLLFVSGDSNDVHVADENGTPLAKTSGDFLSSHCFAQQALRVGVSFSGTAFRVLGRDGKVLFEFIPRERFFLKTCALSADGQLAVLHYDSEQKDWLALFRIGEDGTGKLLGRSALPAVFPHLLALSVGSGGILVGTPQTVLFYDDDVDLVWSRNVRLGPMYRPVYSGERFFAFGLDDDLIFLDEAGRQLVRLSLPTEGQAWRILPTRDPGMVAIQVGARLLFFKTPR